MTLIDSVLLFLLAARQSVALYNRAQQPQREVFYVGGEYTNFTTANQTSQYMIGQIYVEKLTPPIVTKEHPVVFIHGLAQTGTNFLETPDGRPGWASFFLERGYVVYLSDQPSRGRSAWHPSIGSVGVVDTSTIEQLFTATTSHNLWPQAGLHTQWPGTGRVGDPIFDAFFASQVQFQTDNFISEVQSVKAYTALLDRIGKAHLVTHSQAGSYGWLIGDQRPALVKSIVALEPVSPPFIQDPKFPGPDRAWGITWTEITYEPSAGLNATQLKTVTIPANDSSHDECILQLEPAKKLKNLVNIPVLVVTGEASYHARYDYCTVKYIRQAGVQVEYADLGKEGIHGNGHMFFMEMNNREIAQRVLGWLGNF